MAASRRTHAVRRFEARAYRPFERVVLVTDEDAREVSRSIRRWSPRRSRTGSTPRTSPPVAMDRGGVLFTGALDAPANEQAALRLASGSCRWCGARCPTRR